MEAANTSLQSGDTPLPESEDALHRALLAANLRHVLHGHTKNVTGVAFSPDSKRLATVSDDDSVKMWDAATGKELSSWPGHSGGLNAVAFMPDSLGLLTAGKDGVIRIWNIDNRQETRALRGHAARVNAISLSPNGTLLATASEDQTVKLWDTVTGHELLTLKGHTRGVTGVAFSHSGKRLATASSDATVKIWDPSTGKELFDLGLSKSTYTEGALAFDPNDSTLVTPGVGDTIARWDIATGREWPPLSGGPPSGIRLLAYSRNGTLAASGREGSVRIWHAGESRSTIRMPGHSDGITAMAFSPDGESLATGDQDYLAKIWAEPNSEEPGTGLAQFHAPVRGSSSASGGYRLRDATEGTAPNTRQVTKVLDVSSGREVLTLHRYRVLRAIPVAPITISPDRNRIAICEIGTDVEIYDSTTGKVTMLTEYKSGTRALAFSPDGKQLAVASQDRTVTMWDALTGQRLSALDEPTGPVFAIEYSADGKRMATAGPHIVEVWDRKTGRRQQSFKSQQDRGHLEFSPDGKLLASSNTSIGIEGTTEIWNLGPVQKVASVPLFNNASFSPDGKQIAGTSGNVAKVADPVTGQTLLTLHGHSGGVRHATFSADGKKLLTEGNDGFQIFDLDIQDLLNLARIRITRTSPAFTEEECKRYFATYPCPLHDPESSSHRPHP
ncbi:WD40 repeat domain-containing protein [Granulicella sibirica]|uniref:High-affnity carbon uptake protein Hat/HatR n=1 Tax=Granulicella sibirica TaxID=2479048 RepID=A0A4Q0T579_9BACT|nr:WD40 repeat domain-containing protein [Granulicella sibirica]RXH58895.1 High-affnity carbon uptake protein Hat/HatR [Granulicella sibirica]